MPKLRFIADQPHDIPDLGRIVEPDELVEVDAEMFKSRGWPETLWNVVDKKSSKSTSEGA